MVNKKPKPRSGVAVAAQRRRAGPMRDKRLKRAEENKSIGISWNDCGDARDLNEDDVPPATDDATDSTDEIATDFVQGIFDARDEEFLKYICLNSSIGYGRMMQLISEEWHRVNPDLARRVGSFYGAYINPDTQAWFVGTCSYRDTKKCNDRIVTLVDNETVCLEHLNNRG